MVLKSQALRMAAVPESLTLSMDVEPRSLASRVAVGPFASFTSRGTVVSNNLAYKYVTMKSNVKRPLLLVLRCHKIIMFQGEKTVNVMAH